MESFIKFGFCLKAADLLYLDLLEEPFRTGIVVSVLGVREL